MKERIIDILLTVWTLTSSFKIIIIIIFIIANDYNITGTHHFALVDIATDLILILIIYWLFFFVLVLNRSHTVTDRTSTNRCIEFVFIYKIVA